MDFKASRLLPRRLRPYEGETVRGQLAIEVESFVYHMCSRLTRGGHRWGAVREDSILGSCRQCRWCRVYQTEPPASTVRTVGNTTWNAPYPETRP